MRHYAGFCGLASYAPTFSGVIGDTAMRSLCDFRFSTKGEVWEELENYKKAPGMARALINSGWLPQFRVFNEIQLHGGTAAEEESAWQRRLSPGQARRRGRRRNPAM